MDRRDFLAVAAAGTVMPVVRPGRRIPQAVPPQDDRAIWIGHMRKLADPVLKNLAAGTLKARMPVEQAAGAKRQNVTHLEAVGRLLAGLAPSIRRRLTFSTSRASGSRSWMPRFLRKRCCGRLARFALRWILRRART